MLKKENLRKIIFIFILIQPFLDAFIYFFSENAHSSFSLFSLIRPLFMAFIYLFIMFQSEISFKKKRRSLTLLGVYLIYGIFHILNIRGNFFAHSYGTILNEIRLLSVYGYYLLTIINFYFVLKLFSKEEANELLKRVIIAVAIVVGLYFIALIIKASPETYPYSIMKSGWKGWSKSTHYVGHIILLSFPVILTTLFESEIFKSKIKYLLFILIIIPAYYLIGTKTPTYGILMSMVFYAGVKLISIIKNKKPLSKSFIFISLITVILFMSLQYTFASQNMGNQLNVYNSDETKEITFYEVDDTGNYEEIGKRDMISQTFEKRVDYVFYKNQFIKKGTFDNRQIQLELNDDLSKISPLRDKLFGYGFYTMPKNTWVETDTLSIYYSFGIVAFIILILIPVGMLVYMFIKRFKYIKQFNVKMWILIFGVALNFGVITVVGYTLTYAQTLFYLVIPMIYLYHYAENYKDEVEK